MVAPVKRALEPKPTVLVVDADDDTRAFYRESFELTGYNVIEAFDGRDALAKALIELPALVVTEIAVPFIDGYALCEILRRDRATANTPILVVTTEARPAQIVRALRSGADQVLLKPTPIETLLTETHRLLKTQPHGEPAPHLTPPPRPVASPEDIAPATPQRRATITKSCPRFSTTQPPLSPPELVCPSCDRPLLYDSSHVGGVSTRFSEQWDRFVCAASCGPFQYRHRTRTLRRVQ